MSAPQSSTTCPGRRSGSSRARALLPDPGAPSTAVITASTYPPDRDPGGAGARLVPHFGPSGLGSADGNDRCHQRSLAQTYRSAVLTSPPHLRDPGPADTLTP